MAHFLYFINKLNIFFLYNTKIIIKKIINIKKNNIVKKDQAIIPWSLITTIPSEYTPLSSYGKFILSIKIIEENIPNNKNNEVNIIKIILNNSLIILFIKKKLSPNGQGSPKLAPCPFK